MRLGFRLPAGLWALFFLTMPFYLLPSGLPQIADLLFAGLAALLVVAGDVRRPAEASRPATWTLWLFILYVFLVNGVWFVLVGDAGILQNILFYAFNGVVFLVCLSLVRTGGPRFVAVTVHAAMAGVFLQVLLMPFSLVAGGFRQELFFNNPNQLGYYALLSATLVAVGAPVARPSAWIQVAFYLCALFLVVLSLSKAAAVGFLLLVAVLSVRHPRVVIGGALVLVFAVPALDARTKVVSNFTVRIEALGKDSDDTFERRGYDRLVNHPEVLFFGAGEGAVWRFRTRIEDRELHSSWGTILFSYGVVGSMIFLAFLFVTFRNAGLRDLALLVPVLAYGFPHQGLRDSLLWVLLALVSAKAAMAREAATAPSPDVPRIPVGYGARPAGRQAFGTGSR